MDIDFATLAGLTKHVDHGKTTLLDKIRGTAVTKAEPGMLTQHVGATYVPVDTIKKVCGDLLDKFKIKLEVPGLLLLDTPGHAAFISLRKRGGSVSDLAILVVDLHEKFQEQTDESLKLLKEFKVPFIVAATKIDRTPGWFPNREQPFLNSFQKQRDDVKDEFEKKLYSLVTQLAERGFDSERFDRVENFTKQIAIVPVSGITGEGVPELLMMLSGLAQNFLKGRLKLSDVGKGMVLEVKEMKGFGTTIDAVLYDGKVKRNDFLVVGGKEPIVTKIKALLEPKPLRELRIEKQFETINELHASTGAKIAAPGLENVIAGSPFIIVSKESEVDDAKKLLQKEVEHIQFSQQIEGVVAKADTLGSLEAMIKLLTEEGVPIRKAEVGNILRQDLVEMQSVKEDVNRCVMIFNVKPGAEMLTMAKDMNIKVFESDVIYRIIEDYRKWSTEKKEAETKTRMEKIVHPVKIKVLKGCVFHVKEPCIVGIEVMAGLLRHGVRLKRLDGKHVGKVKAIEREGKSVVSVKPGEKVAISMEEPTAGRTFVEGDILVSELSEEERIALRVVQNELSEDEKALLESL